MNVPMFDKQINVSLFRRDGSVAYITCPPTGRKPTIRLSGDVVAQDVIQQLELRITNFITDVPLSEYSHGGHVTIEAGYKGSLRTSIEGEVLNSFQETPGPDGVTVFQVLQGYFTDWTTKTLNATYPAGTSLRKILQEIADALGLNLLYFADPSLVLPIGISNNGLAKELVVKLRTLFSARGPEGDWSGLSVRPDGQTLIVMNKDIGSGLVYQLDYISLANHNAAGFDIQAPWIPPIRPGDTIQVDPKYFRQTFGGGQMSATGNQFRVIRNTFNFCTTDGTNMMTLITVDEGRISKVHTPAMPRTTVAPMRPM